MTATSGAHCAAPGRRHSDRMKKTRRPPAPPAPVVPPAPVDTAISVGLRYIRRLRSYAPSQATLDDLDVQERELLAREAAQRAVDPAP